VIEPKSDFKVSYVTFSNLQMFDICPLHYKARVIFNIPTPATAAQSFGITVHKTLQNFYKIVQDTNKLPKEEVLQKILKEEWDSEGYVNKKHEEERFIVAKRNLSEFYKTEIKDSVVPLRLEYPFNFTLKNGVKVFGKIDRIDPKGKGIEIIDYKTGGDNPKADAAHKLQLAIYALAASRIKDDVLNKNAEDITLTLHFFDGNTKKSMNFNAEDLEKLEEDLLEKINEIEKSDFKCSGSVLCVNCEYKMLCNVHAS
jgi:DNA helicase-2/ATP-dependent DNA helicase PcrA